MPCADYFPDRDAALLAHATQVDPDGMWFAIPMDIQRRVHPVEDFELAVSLGPVDLPEDDLFAGLASVSELDEQCALPPERDATGAVLTAYTAPVPEPQQQVAEAAEGDDGDDELRGSEGHSNVHQTEASERAS